ncbi:MAG: pyridoxine 5'-phosphate synthase, partial [Desulfofustis sp. PB-SRB1]|nr:pyridoxine 5'-phosphate synthase [Desulfofustis sp. PB-SRB1]
FIDPLESQIEAADDVGATFVELHTGTYADAKVMMNGRRNWIALSRLPPPLLTSVCALMPAMASTMSMSARLRQ